MTAPYAYLVTSDMPLAALVAGDHLPILAPTTDEENAVGFAPATATVVGVAQLTARLLPEGATVSFPVRGEE